MSDDRYTRTTYDGKTVDRYTRWNLERAAEKLGYPLTILQGSYNTGGVSASAGTHDGGGVVDLAPYDWERKVRVLRELGFAAWHRPYRKGVWTEHIHAVLIGNEKLAPLAAQQVTAYRNLRDGLAGNAYDGTWHPSPIVNAAYGTSTPSPFKVATLTVMTANVQGYDKTPNAASLTRCRDLIEASLVFTNETGAFDTANNIYPHADRIARTLGNWGYVCHGPGNFLSNGIYWAPPKYKMLHEGQFTTYGTHHHRATWALLNRLDADTLFIALSTHLEYRPAGSNDVHTTYDDIRQKQVAAALSKAEALAAQYATEYHRTHIPVIFGADCNGDLNDGYDGPGHAFAAAGYVDAERVARVNVNTDKTTYTGTRGFVAGDRLDRLAFEKNTPVLELITQPNSGSDHAAVGATVQLTNGPRP